MKWVTIGAALVLALALSFVAVVFAASESGTEVVTLRTLDAQGMPHETRLWVVEHEGRPWLRAGRPDSAWLQRLTEHPQVQVVRGGEVLEMVAVPVHDPATRDAIHALMRERYGLPDRVVSLIRDPNGSVPVRLDPPPEG